MGSPPTSRSTRCFNAACFVLGFVISGLLMAAMLWIIWFYFGLSIVQVSNGQRRAIVNYTSITPKPSNSPGLYNRTISDVFQSSLNTISKSAVTVSSISRGSSRGESPAPKKDEDKSSTGESILAKGDFAARPQSSTSQNTTQKDISSVSSISSSHGRQVPILSKVEEDDVLHTRRVSTSNSENRAQDKHGNIPDITPTQVHGSDRPDTPIRDERRPLPRNPDRTDQVQSSKPAYRDPDFERDSVLRRPGPGRSRYDDEDDDDRKSPSRYDRHDRGRVTDDKYSKGDTRVYPDERPRYDDRYRDDDRYPPRDDGRRRGDDRYRDDDRYPPRDEDRRRGDDRDLDDRYRYRAKDRYRSDDRSRKDDRYRDDRRFQDDDRYRSIDDRYRYRDDDRYEDRSVSKDRFSSRDDDDRYRSREDRYRDDDRYKDEDREYASRDRYRTRDDDDRLTRTRDRDSIMSSRPERLPERTDVVSRDDSRRLPEYDTSTRDRSRTAVREQSRSSSSSSHPDEDRYSDRDEYRRPYRDDDRDRILPTRVRDDAYVSPSTLSNGRRREDDRYSDRDDEYKRSSRYDDRDRILPTRVKDDAYSSPSTFNNGRRRDDDRYTDDRGRTYYDDDSKRSDVSRTILPSSVREPENNRRGSRNNYRSTLLDDRRSDAKFVDRKDDVVLDHRSYASEEGDDYRKTNSNTRPYDDRDRKSSKDSARDYDDYPRRTSKDDDDQRDDYPIDSRPRDRDRYDRRYDEDDDRRSSSSRKYYPEYEETRRRDESNGGQRKDMHPRDLMEEDKTTRLHSEIIDDRRPLPSLRDPYPENDGDSFPQRPSRRDSISDDRSFRARPDAIDDRPLRPVVDRHPGDDHYYREETSKFPEDSLRSSPSRPVRRNPLISSSMTPKFSDAVVREKRYRDKEESTRRVDSYIPDDASELPLNAKDVIDAAIRLSDQSPRKVFYPVFDPRVSNLTSPDIIRTSERKGTTIMSRRRKRQAVPVSK